MIMKTTRKTNTPLRLAASALAIGALMATAPYTLAGPDTPTEHSVEKKVMKWVTDDDGVKTKRHIEITNENGIKTAYEIDELGNRTVIDLKTAGLPDFPMTPSVPGEHKIQIFSTLGEDGQLFSNVEELVGGIDGDKKVVIIKRSGDIDVEHGGEHKMIIKRMHGDGQSFAFSDDENFEFHEGGTKNAKMMVSVAADMMKNVDTDDMDRTARRKVETAQKALKEAMEVLEDE